MPGAVELTFETGVIVYDALFLALAEDADTPVVTADSKLLKALEGTPYARLALLPGRRRQPHRQHGLKTAGVLQPG